MPAMKNSKMLTRGKLITKPEYQKWMDKAAEDLEYQLRCIFQTKENEIQTEQQLHFLTSSLLPMDDCCAWIGQLCVSWQQVSKGSEGARIVIENISNEKTTK